MDTKRNMELDKQRQEMLNSYVSRTRQESQINEIVETINPILAGNGSMTATLKSNVLHYIVVGKSDDADPFADSVYEVDEKELKKLDTEIAKAKTEEEKDRLREMKQQVQAKLGTIKLQGLKGSKKVLNYFTKGEELRGLEAHYAELKKNAHWHDFITGKRGERKAAKKKIKQVRKTKKKQLLDFQAGSIALTNQFIKKVNPDTTFDQYVESFDEQLQMTALFKLNKKDSKQLFFNAEENLFSELYSEKTQEGEAGSGAEEQNKEIERGKLDKLSKTLTGLLLHPVLDENDEGLINHYATSLTEIRGIVNSDYAMPDQSLSTELSPQTRAFIDICTLNNDACRVLAHMPKYARMLMIVMVAETLRNKLDRDDRFKVNDIFFGDLDGITRMAEMTLASDRLGMQGQYNLGVEKIQAKNKANANRVVEEEKEQEGKEKYSVLEEQTELTENLKKNVDVNADNDRGSSDSSIEKEVVIVEFRNKIAELYAKTLTPVEAEQKELIAAFKKLPFYSSGINFGGKIEMNEQSNALWNKISSIHEQISSGGKEVTVNYQITLELTRYFITFMQKMSGNSMFAPKAEKDFMALYSKVVKGKAFVVQKLKEYFETEITVSNFDMILGSKSCKAALDRYRLGDKNALDLYALKLRDQYRKNVAELKKWEEGSKSKLAIESSNAEFIKKMGGSLCLMTPEDTLNKAKLHYFEMPKNAHYEAHEEKILAKLNKLGVHQRFWPAIYEKIIETTKDYYENDDIVMWMENRTFDDYEGEVLADCEKYASNIEKNTAFFNEAFQYKEFTNDVWVTIIRIFDAAAILSEKAFRVGLQEYIDMETDYSRTDTIGFQSVQETWKNKEKEIKSQMGKNNKDSAYSSVYTGVYNFLIENKLCSKADFDIYWASFEKALADVLANHNKLLPEVVRNINSIEGLSELNLVDGDDFKIWIENALNNAFIGSKGSIFDKIANEKTRQIAFTEVLKNGQNVKDLTQIIEARYDFEDNQDKLQKQVADKKFSVLINKITSHAPIEFDYLSLSKDDAKMKTILKRIDKFNQATELWGELKRTKVESEFAENKNLDLEIVLKEFLRIFSSTFEDRYSWIDANTYRVKHSNGTEELKSLEKYEDDYESRLENFFKYLNGEEPTNTVNVRIRDEMNESAAMKERFTFLQKKMKELNGQYNFFNFYHELTLLGREGNFLSKGCSEEKVLFEADGTKYNQQLHGIAKNFKRGSSLDAFKESKLLSAEKDIALREVEATLVNRTESLRVERSKASTVILNELNAFGDALEKQYNTSWFKSSWIIDRKKYDEMVAPIKRKLEEVVGSYDAESFKTKVAEFKMFCKNFKAEDKFFTIYDVKQSEKNGDALLDSGKKMQEVVTNLGSLLEKTMLGKGEKNFAEKLDKNEKQNIAQFGVGDEKELATKIGSITLSDYSQADAQHFNSLVATSAHANLNPYVLVLQEDPRYWSIMTTSETPILDLERLYSEEYKQFDEFFNQRQKRKGNEAVISDIEKNLFLYSMKSRILAGEFKKKTAKEIGQEYDSFISNYYNKKVGGVSINDRILKLLSKAGNDPEVVGALSDLAIMNTRGFESIYVYYDTKMLEKAVAKYKKRRTDNWKLINLNNSYKTLADTLIPGTDEKKNIKYKERLDAFLNTRVMECEPEDFAKRIDGYVKYVEMNVQATEVKKENPERARRDAELAMIGIVINGAQHKTQEHFKKENEYFDRARRLRNNRYSPVAYSRLSKDKKKAFKLSNLNSFKMFFMLDDNSVIKNDDTLAGFVEQYPAWGKFLQDMVIEMNINEIQFDSTVKKNAQRVLNYITLAAKNKFIGPLGKDNPNQQEDERKIMYLICHNVEAENVGTALQNYQSVLDRINALKALTEVNVDATDVTAELKDNVECLEYMLFAEMDSDLLLEKIEQRFEYFNCLSIINNAVNDALRDYYPNETPENRQILKKEMQKMLAAEPISKDVYTATEKIRNRVRTILVNPNYRDVLLTRSGLLSYGSVSSAEKSAQKSAANDLSLEQFVQFIAENVSEKEAAKFKALEENQQKAFALALTLPAEIRMNDSLHSGELLFGSEEGEAARNKLILQDIARYLVGASVGEKNIFKPARDRLLNIKGRFNKEIFTNAAELIDSYIKMLSRYTYHNWDALNNPNDSAEVFKQVSGVHYKGDADVKSIDDFKAKLMDTVTDEKLKKRLASYQDDERLIRLVTALQNRSILDKPTDKKSNASVVNEHMRRETWKMMTTSGMNQEKVEKAKKPAYLTRAFTTLLSCQVKDDVRNKLRITADDLAEGALERTTALDEKLLERALDFVDASASFVNVQSGVASFAYDKQYYKDEHASGGVPSKYDFTVNEILKDGLWLSELRNLSFAVFGEVSDFKKDSLSIYLKKQKEEKDKAWEAELQKMREQAEKAKLLDEELIEHAEEEDKEMAKVQEELLESIEEAVSKIEKVQAEPEQAEPEQKQVQAEPEQKTAQKQQ